jgi:hypothetical protein
MSDEGDAAGGMVYVEGFRLLSRAAVDLHAFAGLSSITEGHPGFISDDYLIAKSAQAKTAVAELESQECGDVGPVDTSSSATT